MRRLQLVTLLFLPLGLVAVFVLLTLPRRMNDLALDSARERARGLTEVMGSLIAADLDFDDRQHAREAIMRLSVERDFLSAEVYGADRGLFVSWPESGQLAPPPSAPAATVVNVGGGALEVIAPVRTAGGIQGLVRMRLSTAPVDAKRRANTAVAGVACAIIVVIGLVFSLATAFFLTRRRAAERALHRIAHSFGLLSDSLPVALVVHRDDRILYANPAAANLLGAARPAALVGQTLSGLFAPGAVLPAPSPEPFVRLAEREITLRDGRSLTVEVASLPHEHGEAAATALVLHDVTERRRLHERLVLSDRMASLGTLAAGVAHEINNPLTVVMANLELSRDALPSMIDPRAPAADAAELVQSLSEANDAAERVRRIVGDLRSLSRASDELGAVDLHQVLERSLQMVQGQIRHRARVARSFAPVPPVLGNESRLVQVFINLLVNAAQALPEDGADNLIEVSTRVDPSGDVIASVRDNGSGIPAAVRDRIFDPFFTTKAVGVGTGLGLAIVHNLVTTMRGRIDVVSEERVGSTFSVRFEATTAAAGQPATVQILANPRARVLVVDDEPTVGDAVSRLLDSHDVTAVPSGSAALDHLATGARFDLILCDVRMPGMSGLELARRMSEAYPDLRRRLAFMTGDASGVVDARREDRGLERPTLEKPFSRDQLSSFVARLLAGKAA